MTFKMYYKIYNTAFEKFTCKIKAIISFFIKNTRVLESDIAGKLQLLAASFLKRSYLMSLLESHEIKKCKQIR